VTDSKRFSRKIGGMQAQDVDLLECLVRIDRGQALDAMAGDLLERLIDGGLVNRTGRELSLTAAGVQRCQSLQHRVASDKEADRILAERGLQLMAPDSA